MVKFFPRQGFLPFEAEKVYHLLVGPIQQLKAPPQGCGGEAQ